MGNSMSRSNSMSFGGQPPVARHPDGYRRHASFADINSARKEEVARRRPAPPPPTNIPYVEPPRVKPAEVRVDPAYRRFWKERRRKARAANEPMSGFEHYRDHQRGPTKQYGFRDAEGVTHYPQVSRHKAQGDPGYDEEHPEEKDLPRFKGQAIAYGVHEGLPVQACAPWESEFMGWSDLGPELDDSWREDLALPWKELEFSRDCGLVFEKELGSGSFGSVWLCTSQLPNKQPKQVAVKVMNLGQYKKIPFLLNRAVREILKESEIMEDHPHRNIIGREYSLMMHDEETGFPFLRYLLVMELCLGDLEDLITSKSMILPKKFSEVEGRRVMSDICHGLKHLHSLNIVHYDIKPRNVLYTWDPKRPGEYIFKLSDFGLSLKFGKCTPYKYGGMGGAGTEPYMAPEVNDPKAGKYDPCLSDIYSLGVTMMQILVGGFGPFLYNIRRHLMSPIANIPLMAARLSISSQALDLIKRMTDRDWASRPDIEQVIADPWIPRDRARFPPIRKRVEPIPPRWKDPPAGYLPPY